MGVCCHAAHDVADFRSGFVWFGSSPHFAETQINFFLDGLISQLTLKSIFVTRFSVRGLLGQGLLRQGLLRQGLLGQGLLRQGLLRQGLLVLTLGFRTFWFCRERSGCAGLVS
jgi:hypothetical protein